MRDILKGNDVLKLLILSVLFFYVHTFYISGLDAVQSLKLKVTDALYGHRYESLQKKSPIAELPLVIVAIDDESLKELGERWPWRRSLMGEFLDQASDLGAQVVGFDLSFSVPGKIDDKPAHKNHRCYVIRSIKKDD